MIDVFHALTCLALTSMPTGHANQGQTRFSPDLCSAAPFSSSTILQPSFTNNSHAGLISSWWESCLSQGVGGAGRFSMTLLRKGKKKDLTPCFTEPFPHDFITSLGM
jgi:hypothetical protein